MQSENCSNDSKSRNKKNKIVKANDAPENANRKLKCISFGKWNDRCREPSELQPDSHNEHEIANKRRTLKALFVAWKIYICNSKWAISFTFLHWKTGTRIVFFSSQFSPRKLLRFASMNFVRFFVSVRSSRWVFNGFFFPFSLSVLVPFPWNFHGIISAFIFRLRPIVSVVGFDMHFRLVWFSPTTFRLHVWIFKTRASTLSQFILVYSFFTLALFHSFIVVDMSSHRLIYVIKM